MNTQNTTVHRSVSVIIPCRNEAAHIAGLLDSVLAQDYPAERLEILVVDGMSDDGTREIIEDDRRQNGRIRLIDNPGRAVPTAMNLGIEHSSGEVIVRMDVHAVYPPDYISRLVHELFALDADNVGGSLETLPADGSRKARAVAAVLAHPFGVGNSHCRIHAGDRDGAVEADTVPFGCYRREVFDRIGLYDEDLIRNQDNELNERLLKAGGKIFLIPSVRIGYFARENYSKLWRMLYQYGYFGPLVDMKLGSRTRLRRYIPALFVLSLLLPLPPALIAPRLLFVPLAAAALHTLCNGACSTALALKKRSPALIPSLISGFAVAHLAYGTGYLAGFLDFRIRKKHTKKRPGVGLSR